MAGHRKPSNSTSDMIWLDCNMSSAGHEHAGANPNCPGFRLNQQWHNHVLQSAIPFDTPHVNWPMGNRVGSGERFVNPNHVEMYHVNFGWQVIAPDAIMKTPPSVTSASWLCEDRQRSN